MLASITLTETCLVSGAGVVVGGAVGPVGVGVWGFWKENISITEKSWLSTEKVQKSTEESLKNNKHAEKMLLIYVLDNTYLFAKSF